MGGCQVWRSKDVEAGEQGFCPDVPEELCWKVFGTLHEASECGAGEWLSAGPGDQFGSAVSEYQVRRSGDPHWSLWMAPLSVRGRWRAWL
jgi:hypothetical protein